MFFRLFLICLSFFFLIFMLRIGLKVAEGELCFAACLEVGVVGGLL
jgi:hypothetical protein